MTTANRQEQLTEGISRGVDLVCASWKPLLVLAAICAISQFLFSLFTAFDRSSLATTFLAVAASGIAAVWLFVAGSMFTVEVLRGRTPRLVPIMYQALLFLPKTFFSSAASFLVLLLSVALPLFLPFGILCFWAPFFVVSELFAPQSEASEWDDEPESPYFLAKSVFDLGIVRAARFGIQRYAFTVQSIIGLWVSFVFTQAVAHFVFSRIPDSGAVTLFISTAAGTAVLVVLMATFYSILPREAQSELGLSVPTAARRIGWVNDLFSRWLSFVLLTAIGATSWWYLYQQYTFAGLHSG